VLPGRLPEVETVFALTVHKSQGSEFGHAVLVLPDVPSPVLTRELVYTGITRAKRKVEIWALPARLTEAVNTRAERAAGLAERLAVDPPTAAMPTEAASGAQDQLSLF
jgi:exodeoxyribonuclease V alpha subunit